MVRLYFIFISLLLINLECYSDAFKFELGQDHRASTPELPKPQIPQNLQQQQIPLENVAYYGMPPGLHHVYTQIKQGMNEFLVPQAYVRAMLKSAPEEIKNIIAILKNEYLKPLWPNTLLLVGKPGVGKSTFAKIIAQECGRVFIFIKCATIANEYQHSGASNIERLFIHIIKMAETQPCAVIFDEINAVADKNDTDTKRQIDTGTSEALWTWLDVCIKNPNILVIGTTNDASSLKGQLASRFDGDVITIEKPQSLNEYKNILYFYLRGVQDCSIDACSEEFLHDFAKKLKDFTPREIEKLVKKAWQNAAARKYKACGDWNQLLPHERFATIENEDLQTSYLLVQKGREQLKKKWYRVASKYFISHGVPILTAFNSLCSIATFILTINGALRINLVQPRGG